MMLAAVSVATKCEETTLDVRALAKLVSVSPWRIWAMEMALLSGLNFDLVVFHAFTLLDALLDDADVAPAAAELGHAFCERAARSDAVVRLPPMQVALAAAEAAGVPRADLARRFFGGDEAKCAKVVRKVQDLVEANVPAKESAAGQAATAAARSAAARAKQLVDPEHDPTADAFRARQKERDNVKGRARDARLRVEAERQQRDLIDLSQPHKRARHA